jgi:hypothetical protein
MSFPLIRAALHAENSDDIHVLRLLILIGASSNRKSTRVIAGIAKLAKLDFLLRYPNCLKTAIKYEGKEKILDELEFCDFEGHSFESKMIRFRYGPWDVRYRRWLGILKSKNLIDVYLTGKTVNVVITDLGKEIYEDLILSNENIELNKRSEAISKVFGGFTGKKLMDFMYLVFPEISSMKQGQEISK